MDAFTPRQSHRPSVHPSKPAGKPSILVDTRLQAQPPKLAETVKNTLTSLTLTQERLERPFQAHILRYGIQLVAHAVLLHHAAEVIAGTRDKASFLRSLQGKTRLEYTFNEGKEVIGSLRALSKLFYIPKCAFQNGLTLKEEADKPVVFFSVDLANLFYERGSGLKGAPTFGGMDTYTKRVKTLEDILRRETIEKGLDLVARGYNTEVTTYIQELITKGKAGPLGAISLIHHYDALITFHREQTKNLLEKKGVSGGRKQR